MVANGGFTMIIPGTVASSRHHNSVLGTLQAPTTSVTPIIPSVDDDGKGFTFTTTSESPDANMYAFSLDNKATWTQCNDDFLSVNYNCRKNFTTDGGWGATSWDKTITIYVGNQNIAAGHVHVKATARSGYLESATFASDNPFTYNPSFDRWRPTGLIYYTSGRHNRSISFRPAVLAWVEHTGYEVTYDGGATTEHCKFMFHYTDNRDVAIGQFGVRYINQLTGEALSGWLYNTEAFTSVTVSTVNITGLKAFDATVTASVTEGSNQITVANNNYNFQIGQQYCFLGAGRRGTRGVGGEWPSIKFSSIGAANTASSNNPNDYVANLYAWAEDTGKTIRLRGDKTQWDNYSDNLPDVNLCQALPLIATITNVVINGGGTVTLTVNKQAKLTESNLAVYFDNAVVIQSQYDVLPQFAIAQHPTGTYPVCSQLFLNIDQTGVHLKMRGLTLFAPPKCVSASLTVYPHGAKVNEYTGSSITIIKGNYNYDDMGFRVWEGDHSQWTDLYLPDLDQPLGHEYYIYNSCYRQEGNCVKANDIEAWNSPHAVIANASSGGFIWGWKIKRTNIIPLITSEGQPYAGSYYWAAYIDTCKGATMDGASKYGNTPDLNIDQPIWLNSYEIFKSVDGTMKNINAINGMGSCNGSAGATYLNVTNTISAGSKYFQNTGHSCQEMNLFMGAPDGWPPSLFGNYHVILEGSLINGENWYPLGLNLTTGIAGAKVLNCSYSRPAMTGYPTAPGMGLKMQGLAAYVDGFIYTGDWDEQYLIDGFGFGGSVDGSSIRLTEEQGKASDAVLKNCSAPTFLIPASMDSSNVVNNTATQRSYIYYPSVWLAASNQTSNSVRINATELDNKEGTILSWGWTQVGGHDAIITNTGNGYEADFTGLSAGVYDFKLTVLNSLRVYGRQDIQITIE